MDEFFYNKLAHFKNKVAAIQDNGKVFTYTDLLKIVDRISESITDANKRLIFIICSNLAEAICGYLASLRCNHTILLLDKGISKNKFDELVNIYKPDFIFEPISDEKDYQLRLNTYGLSERKNNPPLRLYPELNLLLSTSGSTGSSKLVKLTNKNLQANAESIARYLKLSDSEKAITVLPMSYSYGLSVINSHLLVGSTLLLTDKSIVTKDFWKFFRENSATSLVGVPYTYEILKKMRFFEMKLTSLKYMTQAGGKLNPKLVKEFAKYCKENTLDFFVMYGQTEATARISYLPPENSIEKHKSIGIAIPLGKIMLINSEGNIIDKPYVEGELIYLGPNVMLGYANKLEDLLIGDQQNGRLKTGDVAYFDEDHFYYITGRMKRFLKIFGNRVNLDEIEHYLKGEGYNCVCGGTDEHLLIGSQEKNILKTLEKKVIEKYNFHHSIVKSVYVKQIIKNSSGKIQYNEIFSEYNKENE